MTDPFRDDEKIEEAACVGDRVVAAVCIYILGAFSSDFITWLQEVAVCLK